MGGRSRAFRARPPGRARRSRGARPAPPLAPGSARPAGGRGVDQPGRSQLRLPAAVRAARRCLRRGDVLRDVQRRGATGERRPCLRRPGVPRRGRPRALRGTGARRRAGGRRRRRLDLGPIAMPRDVRAGAGRLRAARGTAGGGARRGDPSDRRRDRGAGLHRRVRRRGRRAADARARGGARVCGSSAAPASSIPRRSTTTAPTAATRRSAPRSRWAPRPRSRP